MQFPLDDLPARKSQDFLDYLRAELRKHGWPQPGTAQMDASGRYLLRLDTELGQKGNKIPVTWEVDQGPSGEIDRLVASSEFSDTAVWREAAEEVVDRALAATLGERTERFFKRTLSSYVGPAIAGEYWLSDFRFAPAMGEEEDSGAGMLERLIAVDQHVEAIDDQHASMLAAVRCRRYIAYLALILDLPFERPLPGKVWVFVHEKHLRQGEDEYRRATRAFPPKARSVDRMPRKGELCEPGGFDWSLSQPRVPWFPEITLPSEAPKLFGKIADASPEIRTRLDGCARLYHSALLIGGRLPSAGLAYRVAAVDALAPRGPSRKQALRSFVDEHVHTQGGEADVIRLLEFLYGKVRSGHFHGGIFPLEDLQQWSPGLPGAGRLELGERARQGHELLRSAILSWMAKTFLLT